MPKAEALAIIDTQLSGNHAELNAKPGVELAKIIAELRAEIDAITEA